MGDEGAGFQSKLPGTIVDLDPDNSGSFSVTADSDAKCQRSACMATADMIPT